jgi:hypothetical protein
MKDTIYRDVTQCSLIEICRRFGEAKQATIKASRFVPEDRTFRNIMQTNRKIICFI